MRQARTEKPGGVRLGLLTNPASDLGKGRKADGRIITLLRKKTKELGYRLRVLSAPDAATSLDLVRSALPDLDLLLVAGGDGIVHIAANALSGSDLPVGIIACGSDNDFARGLGLPIHEIETSVDLLLEAWMQRSILLVDLLAVDPLPSDSGASDAFGASKASNVSTASTERVGGQRTVYVAGSLSCSIDAAINQRANRSPLPWGPLRYVQAGVSEASHPLAYGFRLGLDAGGTEDGPDKPATLSPKTPLLLISNAQCISSGIRISPYSSLQDGHLDLVWAKWMPSPLQAIRTLLRGYKGLHIQDRLIGWKRVKAVTIAASGRGTEPPDLMGDGEMIGRLPVRVSCRPRAVRILFPLGLDDPEKNQKDGVQTDGRHKDRI